MKDGRTHLGYKAEHVVDLESDVILSAQVHHGTEARQPDADAGSDRRPAEPDPCGESRRTIAGGGGRQGVSRERDHWPSARGTACGRTSRSRSRRHEQASGPTSRRRSSGRWSTTAPRARREKGRRLQRLAKREGGTELRPRVRDGRSQTQLAARPREDQQALRDPAAAHNLGVLMRKLFGIGKPRGLAAGWAAALHRDFRRPARPPEPLGRLSFLRITSTHPFHTQDTTTQTTQRQSLHSSRLMTAFFNGLLAVPHGGRCVSQ